MSNKKLKDPVDGQTFESEIEEMENAISIDGLDLSDFTVPEQKYTKSRHPFDGYPEDYQEIIVGNGLVKKMVDVEVEVDEEVTVDRPAMKDGEPVLIQRGPNTGQPKMESVKEIQKVKKMVKKEVEVLEPIKQRINATHLVAMNPTVHIHQDPSGEAHELGDGRIVDLKTTHNRVVVDTDTRRNTDLVFDRELHLKSGKTLQYAIVRNHGARAQLIFHYDPQKERVMVDSRYMLLDKGQMSRLRQTFDQWNFQQMRAEKLSKQFDTAEESTAGDKG